ncbi:YaiI/YqxD family protein [Arenicella sp. 4NH20-0111]|uniref:YaiI/YqxD family protein n=1 Tax=Arenicella sp. 4NH20-0111 TaxID=3127648 RepID=UPI00310390E4
MKIWVDADACPVVIKDILFRAAERTKTKLTLVANQAISHPESEYINSIQVGRGFDLADNEIVRLMNQGDLIITSDIPLAAEALEKGGDALTPRGERFSLNSIQAKLTMRDFMDTLRGSGEHSGGPAPLNSTDRRTFANELDRWLAKNRKIN